MTHAQRWSPAEGEEERRRTAPVSVDSSPVQLKRQEDAAGSDSTRLLHRLYVMGVPPFFTDADLQKLFEQHGEVRDLAIMYDKATGASRGYAFVSYGTRDEADTAIAALDGCTQLPGAHAALQVRYAKNQCGIPLDAGPSDNCRLHFSRAPGGSTYDTMHDAFARFGQVVHLELLSSGSSSRASSLVSGFAQMASHEQAEAALRALNGKVMPGGIAPLRVEWADPNMQAKKRRAQKAAQSRTIFFARAPPTASKADVAALFSPYGSVLDVAPLGQRRAGTPSGANAPAAAPAAGSTSPRGSASPGGDASPRACCGSPRSLSSAGSAASAAIDDGGGLRGCGLVVMASVEEVLAASAALHMRHVWPGMAAPMVARPLDGALAELCNSSTDAAAIAAAAIAAEDAAAGLATAAPSLPGGGGAARPPAPYSPTYYGEAPGVAQLAAAAAAHVDHAASAAAAAATAAATERVAGGDAFPTARSGSASSGGAAAAHAPPPVTATFVLPGSPAPLVAARPPASAQLVMDVPPPGCASCAYKLFVGNLPRSVNEPVLRLLFEPFGKVIEAVVLRDRTTRASRGAAFVWLQTGAQADSAAQRLSGAVIVSGSSDGVGRAVDTPGLVVRRANLRSAPTGNGGTGGVADAAAAAATAVPLLLTQQQQQQQLLSSVPSRVVHLPFSGSAATMPAAPAAAAFTAPALMAGHPPAAPTSVDLAGSGGAPPLAWGATCAAAAAVTGLLGSVPSHSMPMTQEELLAARVVALNVHNPCAAAAGLAGGVDALRLSAPLGGFAAGSTASGARLPGTGSSNAITLAVSDMSSASGSSTATRFASAVPGGSASSRLPSLSASVVSAGSHASGGASGGSVFVMLQDSQLVTPEALLLLQAARPAAPGMAPPPAATLTAAPLQPQPQPMRFVPAATPGSVYAANAAAGMAAPAAGPVMADPDLAALLSVLGSTGSAPFAFGAPDDASLRALAAACSGGSYPSAQAAGSASSTLGEGAGAFMRSRHEGYLTLLDGGGGNANDAGVMSLLQLQDTGSAMAGLPAMFGLQAPPPQSGPM